VSKATTPISVARLTQASSVGQIADADVFRGVDLDGLDRRGGFPLAGAEAAVGSGAGRAHLRHRRGGHAVAGRCVPDPAGQAAEFHLLEEGGQGRAVRIAHRQVLDRLGQGGVAVELDQLARQPDLVGEVDQGLAALLLLDLTRPGPAASRGRRTR
jgi:hypothetical protein